LGIRQLHEALETRIAEERKGVMGFLTDFGFKQFITGSVIKFIHAIIVVLTALEYIGGLIVAAVSLGEIGIVGWLIFGTLVTLVELCIARVFLESLIVFFRIYEDVHALAGQQRGASEPVIVFASQPGGTFDTAIAGIPQ
jgi:hypothetical protein